MDPRRHPTGSQALRPHRTLARPVQRLELPPALERALEEDARFQVMTLDQQHWLCPYTALPVPASLGRLKAAREYLLSSQVWRQHQPLPLDRLVEARWRLDLEGLVQSEPRLRIFGRDGQGWLNPWTGELVPGIDRIEGRIAPRTLAAMAAHLATCPAAQRPMLDQPTILARGQVLGLISRASPAARETLSTTPALGQPAVAGDLARARDVQRRLLAALPEVPGWDLAVHHSAHAGVSGDFYAVLPLPDGRQVLLLGDVSGHGMQGALVAATALKALRMLAREANGLIGLIDRLNGEVKPDLLPGQFITLTAAALDPATGTVECLRAGHHASLLARPNGSTLLQKVGRKGMAVGLVAGPAFASSLAIETFTLDPGDLLLAFTDGVLEAQDRDRTEFGEHRLCASLFSHLGGAMQDLVDGISRDALRYANGVQEDDLSLLAVARKG